MNRQVAAGLPIPLLTPVGGGIPLYKANKANRGNRAIQANGNTGAGLQAFDGHYPCW